MKNNYLLVFFKDYIISHHIKSLIGAVHARGREGTLLDYCWYYGWK